MSRNNSQPRQVAPLLYNGIRTKVCQECKDLSVLISSDLSWSSHVDAVVKKANKVLGVVHRTLGSSNQEAFSILYKALVRPILEYAVPLWCPYLVKDILALEKVQRRASRLALGQKGREIDYVDRLKILY